MEPMVDLLEHWLGVVRSVARGSGPWLAFNAVLATIPAVLAVGLFHRPRARTPLWWAGVAAFVVFLPNAPYVITDLIHLRGMIDANPGSPGSGLVPAGALAALVLWGLGSYAVCLAQLDRVLRRGRGAPHRSLIRGCVHVACGFGVVLGRVPRLHSWHLVTRPRDTVDGIVSLFHPLAAPLILALAVAFALGAAALTAVARAATERTVELATAARGLIAGRAGGARA